MKQKCEKDKVVNVHAGHRDRLREQFFYHSDTMREHQILELMLSYVIPQKDTNPIAHDLINKFGSLSQVVDSPIEELMKVKGVSKVVASFLNFESKFVGIYKLNKASNKPCLNSINSIMEYMKEVVEIGDVEKFYYMCLDTKGKLICFRDMGVGSSTSVNLSSKDFINSIINYKAHAVALCHTHPCGQAYPSKQDRMLTNLIYSLLRSINVQLVDHIILSHQGSFSFSANKLIGAKLSQPTSTQGLGNSYNDFENTLAKEENVDDVLDSLNYDYRDYCDEDDFNSQMDMGEFSIDNINNNLNNKSSNNLFGLDEEN